MNTKRHKKKEKEKKSVTTTEFINKPEKETEKNECIESTFFLPFLPLHKSERQHAGC